MALFGYPMFVLDGLSYALISVQIELQDLSCLSSICSEVCTSAFKIYIGKFLQIYYLVCFYTFYEDRNSYIKK